MVTYSTVIKFAKRSVLDGRVVMIDLNVHSKPKMSEQFCFELKGRLSFNKAIKMGTDIRAAVYTYFN